MSGTGFDPGDWVARGAPGLAPVPEVTAGGGAEESFDYSVASVPVGGLLYYLSPTAFFAPVVVRVTRDELSVRKRTWFGLRRDEFSMPVAQLMAVRVVAGLRYGALHVETMGGAFELRLGGLLKREARDFAEILRGLILHRTERSASAVAGAGAPAASDSPLP